jgi:Ca2+-binding EF-hand superfamily protein
LILLNLCLVFFFFLQDLNENGYIMYTDFIAATIEAHGYIEEDRIAEAFDRLDSDETGFSKCLSYIVVAVLCELTESVFSRTR